MKTKPGTVRLVPTLTILLFATACVAAPTWLGFETLEDGVPAVHNPESPVHGETLLEPEQLWRIGGDDDPNETLLGLITDAVVDPDGVTYILDATMSTVLAVSEEGEILRRVGREGDGPGEFRSGQELELLPDGNLGVLELMPGKVVVMDCEGIPAAGWRLFGDGGQTGMSHMRHMETAGDALVVGLISTSFDDGKVVIRNILGRYGADGAQLTEILETSREQSGGAISLTIGGDDDFAGNFTVLPDERIVVFQKAQEYKVEIFAPDGSPQRIIRRDYESLRRSDEDIEESREIAAELSTRFGDGSGDDVAEYERDISQIVARADGMLWVLSSRGVRGCPAGHLGVFDVFDADGRFDRTLRIAADYDAEDDNFLVVGDRLYVFKQARNAPDRSFSAGGGAMVAVMVGGGGEEEEDGEEPMPFEVICYRLP